MSKLKGEGTEPHIFRTAHTVFLIAELWPAKYVDRHHTAGQLHWVSRLLLPVRSLLIIKYRLQLDPKSSQWTPPTKGRRIFMRGFGSCILLLVFQNQWPWMTVNFEMQKVEVTV